MPHLEQGRAILLASSAGGQDHRALERRAPDRRLHHPLKRDAGRDAQAAFDQITPRRELHRAAALGRFIETLLNGRRVVASPVAFGPPGQDRKAARGLGGDSTETGERA